MIRAEIFRLDSLDLKLNKFMGEFRINIDLNKKNYNALAEIKLLNILPKRLDFQQKNQFKIAFSLFSIDLPIIDNNLWEKIFSKESKGYIKIRNEILHAGVEDSFMKRTLIDIKIVYEFFQHIAKFTYLINKEIISKYPNLIIQTISYEIKNFFKS